MHAFTDLIYRGTTFTVRSLNEAESRVGKLLRESGSTVNVKNLQMIRLQKAILAVGMFSMFDAALQSSLASDDGFASARAALQDSGKVALVKRFDLFVAAVNVLKHGHGRSHDYLLAQKEPLPFRVRRDDDPFFNEGDVSEISTLVEVTDQFVADCAQLIEDVGRAITKSRGVYI